MSINSVYIPHLHVILEIGDDVELEWMDDDKYRDVISHFDKCLSLCRHCETGMTVFGEKEVFSNYCLHKNLTNVIFHSKGIINKVIVV